jgi:hypothetical protein
VSKQVKGGLLLAIETMTHDPVLQEDVVCRKGCGPSGRSRGQVEADAGEWGGHCDELGTELMKGIDRV